MEKEQKTVLQIYIGFAVSILLSFIPSSAVQTFGTLLFIIVLIAAYIYRRKAEDESLMNSHMVYLIKSFWISSLLISAGIAAAFFLADHSIINDFVDGLMDGIAPDQEEMNIMMMDYLRANLFVFLLTLGPGMVYLAYRIAKGIALVKNNEMISNPKSWF